MKQFETQLLLFWELCRDLNWGSMSPGQFARIADMVQEENLLVFGAGRDTSFWNSITSSLLVLEDEPAWIKSQEIDIKQVVYWGCLNQPLKDPNKILCQLEGDECQWDAVLVDGPRGYRPTDPGREESIFAAASLRDEHTATVFVHDYERSWEKACCDKFLGLPDEQVVSELDDDERILAIWY